MSKKILFFSSWPKSHLFPLKSLITFLEKKNFEVYVLTIKSNKKIVEDFLNSKYIEYPFNLDQIYHEDYMKSKLESSQKYFIEKKYKKSYIEFLKSDISIVLNYDKKNSKKLKEIVNNIKPNYIFRDAVDIYAHEISIENNIPCIGYITNNLYSSKFFEKDPKYLYQIFMAGINYERLLGDEFFLDFYSLECELYEQVSEELNTKKIIPFHQFDPNENINIIFSTDFLQPEYSLYKDKKYDISYPSLEQLSIEKKINTKLVHFLNKNFGKKIAYVSTGSFINKDFTYYKTIINALIKEKYYVVLSVRNHKENIKEYFQKYNDMIYIDSFIEQKYILSCCNLFITSGGFNSILESIYYKVPMLIIPVSSEQRLNGLIIEELKLGKSYYSHENVNKSYSQLIHILEQDPSIKLNLEKYSQIIIEKSQRNNFENLERFLINGCCD